MRLAAAMLIASVTSACAGWCDLSKDECWTKPDKPKPQVRAWVKHAPARVIVKKEVVIKHDLDEVQQCRAAVSVVGDEARSKEAAELQSRQHWMKQVRFHLGEKFIELGNARDIYFQCSRSDFPISGGKVGALADAISHSWRCSIRAVPCSQAIVREEK